MPVIVLAVLLFLTSASLVAQVVPASRPAEVATPEAILAQIEALPRPTFDRSRSSDAAYIQEYSDQMNAIGKRQDELEQQFYQRFPDHPQAEQILVRRWSNQLVRGVVDRAQVAQEIEQYLQAHPDGPRSREAREQLATVRARLVENDEARLLALAEEFAKQNPKNEHGANLFLMAAGDTRDPLAREKLYRRIMMDYPNSRSAIRAGGKLRQISQIGMPFDLGFFDAITGEWIHTRNLQGKVIVIDFWATWCGPCIGEIPKLRELYARYKDRGLEIIGVSLDGPGYQTDLDTLKRAVEKHQITWPQYYQGEGFDSAFSASWGINAIPTVFVIDQAGRLHSTEARSNLDMILADLFGEPAKQRSEHHQDRASHY